MNPNLRNPYVVRWELSIQRQLPKQFVLEVAYIGNHAIICRSRPSWTTFRPSI